jgi:hypothetical protein
LYEKWSLGLRRFVLPNKINKILWRIDELGTRRVDFGIDQRRLFVGYHSSINSDPCIFHMILTRILDIEPIVKDIATYHKPFDPILGLTSGTSSN